MPVVTYDLSHVSRRRTHTGVALHVEAIVDSSGPSQHPSCPMSSSFRQRLSAILMLPVLLFAGLARSGELFRCQYDEVVREACCCPSSRTSDTNERTLRSVATGCCDVSTIKVDTSPKDAPRQVSVVPPASGPALTRQQLVIADLRPAGMMSGDTTQDTSPPIIRVTCSLLI
jgi:hypothetical protein